MGLGLLLSGLYRRPRNSPPRYAWHSVGVTGSCISKDSMLVGFTTDREFAYSVSVTLPRRYEYSVVRIITITLVNGQGAGSKTALPAPSDCLRLDDAVYWADGDALGRIKVADALHAGFSVNDIDVAFADRVGGAFRQAGAAGNAVILNFHSHSIFSLSSVSAYVLILILGKAVK